jgi:predicted transcriptional regulator of viral defense system
MEMAMRSIEDIKSIFADGGGMMRTAQLSAAKVFYKDIQQLMADGMIEKIRYGYYQWIDPENLSEVIVILHLFPDAILCMDTALFYYGYSDRTPLQWHIAVSKDSGKSRFKIDYPFVKPYYVEPALLDIGRISGKIDGHLVRIYDKERTICDCLRYARKMDKEIFNKAIQGYINDSTKDIASLIRYAKALRVVKKLKDLIGMWL